MARRAPAAIPGQLSLEPVFFFTWKKYGFRHITQQGSLKIRKTTDYNGQKIEYTEGISLCGHAFSMPHYPEPTHPRQNWVDWDLWGQQRPLCGTCRKSWKKQTGQQVD